MTLTMLLTTAYSAVGALGVMAYLPQLRKLLADAGRSEHMPLFTWVLWGAQTQVVFLYGVFVVQTPAYIAVNLLTMLACNTCLGALLYNRFFKPLTPRIEVTTASNVIALAHHRQVA